MAPRPMVGGAGGVPGLAGSQRQWSGGPGAGAADAEFPR